MNKKALVLIAFVLLSAMFISGCTETGSSIKNTEQVSDAVSNISDNVNDVSSVLDDIDTKLGGS